MLFPRSSGILLHPTSFPGRYGIGDLGTEAYQFIDFLVGSDQQFWQILPLGPTGYGNSPYACYSAMAGNPMLVSPEQLQMKGLLTDEDLSHLPEFPVDEVDFDRVFAIKKALLIKACDRFQTEGSPEFHEEFDQFCERHADWLDDYALFMALHNTFGDASWHKWEPDIAKREPAAVDKWRRQLSDRIYYQKYVQFEFFRQWSWLKNYANERNIRIIGDIPFYVAHNSADVWAHRDIFALDEETGEPKLMAGVPPDYFSETGQLWGNPIYKWEKLEQTNFRWWLQRIKMMFEYVDVLRIDHFRGFQAYWEVPQGETTAMNGRWVEAPGDQFFQVLKQELGGLPIIAEDLGLITPEVLELRDRFEFPGMKILQFAFGGGPDNLYLPFNINRHCIIYTGTHDNNTTIGWFNQIPNYERENVLRYLGCVSPEGINWDMIRLALSSIADLAIVPMQDLLDLGGEAQMNAPSTTEGNWKWRYRPPMLNDSLRERLKTLTYTYGRTPMGS
ncbi:MULTISPECIES: 4-alpha-glucanotransferase [unclassified Coleofasciculus]|uniref:4-alpha-glucanotransferase n=1 Tax=unclassified Coleofasciculus TaxID=2692782 RepID=UPI00187FD7FF|nr:MULTISPECIES: 4-alpha-glucanotransferase [unclassified Coleofasciculus]MBE9127356.1 4-alpha-glucanotransferase [Coleofasciculus sp. LEGE 07081]MBE9150660.1 4-alpha-glucanotransferase [Coleofasciculus sp. LEGE 07092]